MASAGNKPEGPKKKLSPAMLFIRDAGIALAFVASILLAMYAYTGLWPPLVVIESDSMMHSDENVSYIGVIDTGDLVLVKAVDDVEGIETYVDGYTSGHRTYGDYGDVIIYRVDGDPGETPIIHRAIIYLEPDASGDYYRAPALADIPKTEGKWATANLDDTWDRLTSILWIYDVGYKSAVVTIDIDRIISSFRSGPLAAGFITKGDHNPNIDQNLASRSSPVEIDWVVGKARGEIPWFGLLKLWFTDTLGSESPENSVRNLWISLALIVTVPIIVDVVLTYRVRTRIARRREQAKREYELELTRTARKEPEPEHVPESVEKAPPEERSPDESP